MNIIDEINTLIKKYAPRPYFTSQEHLEDIIQNESLAEVRADFVMDEWVIGHITEIIEKYQEPKWIPVSNPREELPKDRILWVTIGDGSRLGVMTLYWDMTEWSENIADYVLAYMDYIEPTPYKAEGINQE